MNHKLLGWLVVTILIYLTIILIPDNAMASDNLTMGTIDAPGNGGVIQGNQCVVRGWFLDKSGVSKIEILVDGQLLGQAAYGGVRTDVGQLYPEYGNNNSGYQYTLNTKRLTNGLHTLSVRETGKSGGTTTQSISVTIENPPPIGIIDIPGNGGIIQGNQSIVRGWFLDSSGVSKIDILVDGQLMGQAAYGGERTDVGKLYPEYENSNAGYQYTLNTKRFTNGVHTLTVRETGINGTTTTQNVSVTVENPPPIGIIDIPGNGGVIQGDQSIVQGWFLDSSGVSKIDILVDGQLMGQAAYGGVRTDVGQLYPEYGNNNSGYQYTLNTKRLTNGVHTLSVRETGKNGTTTTQNISVTVGNPSPIGIIDSPRNGEIIQGDQSIVRGWFLDSSGVSKIDILIDGKPMGQAAYGGVRTDVGQLYPEYGNNNSGYQYTLNTKRLTNGLHTLSVRETGKSGGTTTQNVSVTVGNPPPIGIIDSPGNGGIMQGDQSIVQGWFLDSSGVSMIDILVDGQLFGQAAYGGVRTDVGKLYPEYGNNNSGYQYALNTKQLTNGIHTLSIRETGKNGATTTQNVSVTVQNLPPLGIIDTPGNGSVIQGDTSILQGWFLDSSGVSKIDILVDGQLMGQAAYGGVRTDVEQFFPEYRNNNSGYQYTLNTKKLTNGTHTLSVRETGENGATTTQNVTVTVRNPPPLGIIDIPSGGGVIQGDASIVRGWFLDGSGVSKIDILVDGQLMGQAAYGGVRTDVDQLYPEYENNNSGYQYGLNTKILSNGIHILSVRETGENRVTTTLNVSINIQNPPPIGVIDIPSDNGIIQGDQSIIRGWFLDGSGVSRIEILADGELMGQAAYGAERNDVGSLYPEYRNNNSGYQYELNSKKLSDGLHIIEVRETALNGRVTSMKIKVTVSNNLPKGALKMGLDISHYQNDNGPINFNSVKNSGVSFIIAKATQGSEDGSAIIDPYFKSNINEASAAGLQTHAYHYFLGVSQSDARAEADWFLKNISGVSINGYLFVDVEDRERLTKDSSQLTEYVSAFLDELKNRGVSKFGIYSDKSFLTERVNLNVLEQRFPNMLVWTAAWHDPNDGPGFSTDLWQYTSDGYVNGISGRVDMDFSYSPIF